MMNWSEYEEQKPKPRPLILPLLFWLASILLLIVMLAGLSGCAEKRWLTKEEDAEMRATCEPVGGCAVIPNPIWKQIERALGMDGA
jgi:hypothetical protein